MFGFASTRRVTSITGIWVAFPSSSASRLAWWGSRCCTITKAIPFFGGKYPSNSIAASKPPADPPIPTIGQPVFSPRGRLERGSLDRLFFDDFRRVWAEATSRFLVLVFATIPSWYYDRRGFLLQVDD